MFGGAMPDFLHRVFASDNFMPHGHCFSDEDGALARARGERVASSSQRAAVMCALASGSSSFRIPVPTMARIVGNGNRKRDRSAPDELVAAVDFYNTSIVHSRGERVA